MKSCIATVAIIGCASAAPQRMRIRSLQGSMSMPEPEIAVDPIPELISAEPVPELISAEPMSVPIPATLPAVDTTEAVETTVAIETLPEVEVDPTPLPATIPAVEDTPVTLPEEISMPSVEESMSAPAAVPETLPEDVVVVEEVLWESLSIPAIYEEIYGASMSMPEEWTPEDAGFVPSETGSGYVEPAETESDESDDVSESDDTPDSAAGVFVSGMVSVAALVGAWALF